MVCLCPCPARKNGSIGFTELSNLSLAVNTRHLGKSTEKGMMRALYSLSHVVMQGLLSQRCYPPKPATNSSSINITSHFLRQIFSIHNTSQHSFLQINHTV